MVQLTNAEKKRLRDGTACALALLGLGEELTVDDLVKLTGQRRSEVQASLDTLVAHNEVVKTGKGYRVGSVPANLRARIMRQLRDGTL